jgi:hypothetical protein
MNDIEMDSPMAATSVVKRRSLSPLLSSTTKRAKLDQDELTSLNVKLNDAAAIGNWSQQLQETSEISRTMILAMSLMYLIDELVKTSAKDDFISPSAQHIGRLVEDMNSSERQKWEDGIRTCIQCGDWTSLITHRTSTVTLQDVFF